MYDVKFVYGSSTAFAGLEQKDAGTLYFLTDTLQIFKGSDEYTKSVKIVSEFPASGQVQGVLYVNTTAMRAAVWNGSGWNYLTKDYATSIPNSGATDDTVPTTKAVADYVTNKIADVVGGVGTFVTEVTYTPASGTLSVAKGAEPTNTVLTGVAHNPSYEPTTRKITIPVFGGENIVINLGKDAVVDSGSYNAESQTIELVLTSGDPVSIPVGDLVDIYTGVATATATTSVSGDNQISVNVKVSTTPNNQLTTDGNGLFVLKPDTYTTSEIDGKFEDATEALEAHTGNNTIHITGEERTAWNAKATVDQVNTAKSEAISTAATDATTKANNAQSAAIEAAATDATSKANQALTDAKAYTDTALTWAEISA